MTDPGMFAPLESQTEPTEGSRVPPEPRAPCDFLAAELCLNTLCSNTRGGFAQLCPGRSFGCKLETHFDLCKQKSAGLGTNKC